MIDPALAAGARGLGVALVGAVNLAEMAALIVLKRLAYLLLRIHHKRAISRNLCRRDRDAFEEKCEPCGIRS